MTPLDDAYLLQEGANPAFNDVLITSPSKLKNRYLFDYLARLHWGDDFFSKIVEQKWKNGMHYMHCTGAAGKKIPTSVRKLNICIFNSQQILISITVN